MTTPIKKRRVITLDMKKDIVEASSKKNLTNLSKQFGLPCSTVQSILKQKQGILSAVDEGGEAKRARLKKVKSENLEKALLQWFKSARSENVQMSGEIIKVALCYLFSFTF